MLGASQPAAVQAACRVLGALAFGDTRTKRHLLSSGVATSLVSQLLRCSSTPVATDAPLATPVATATATVPAHIISAQIPAAARAVSAAAARALQDLVLRSAPGTGTGTHHPTEEGGVGTGSQTFQQQEQPAAHSPQQPRATSTPSASKGSASLNSFKSAEHFRRGENERKVADSAFFFVPPIPASVFTQAAAMLEAVLDSTSATAMQQLSLPVDAAALGGVATGVLGAVAKVVSTICCGKMAWSPAMPASPRGETSPGGIVFLATRFLCCHDCVDSAMSASQCDINPGEILFLVDWFAMVDVVYAFGGIPLHLPIRLYRTCYVDGVDCCAIRMSVDAFSLMLDCALGSPLHLPSRLSDICSWLSSLTRNSYT